MIFVHGNAVAGAKLPYVLIIEFYLLVVVGSFSTFCSFIYGVNKHIFRGSAILTHPVYLNNFFKGPCAIRFIN